jgi:predicted O-methyltransferase YrrM
MQYIDNRILQIDGWMTQQELEWLFNTAYSLPRGSLIVEIGSWKGRSTSALYMGAGSNKAIVAIDTWQGQPDLRQTAHKEATEKNLFRTFLVNMQYLNIHPEPYKRNVLGPQFLISDSVQASECFCDNSIQFVFIDGDHTNADKDIIAWYPKICVGGIIGGHDYNWDSVYNGVNNTIGQIDAQVGSIWIKQK